MNLAVPTNKSHFATTGAAYHDMPWFSKKFWSQKHVIGEIRRRLATKVPMHLPNAIDRTH